MDRREQHVKGDETQLAYPIGAAQQRVGAARHVMTEDRADTQEHERRNADEQDATTRLFVLRRPAW
jgi:hypothetical protein